MSLGKESCYSNGGSSKLKNQLPKVLVWLVFALALVSCTNDVVEQGDPAIVAEFDFAKAWKEAVPTTGAIVELDSIYSIRGAVAKEATLFASDGHETYEYKYYQIRDESQLRQRITLKAIVNDLGDTIFIYNSSGERGTSVTIYKLGFLGLYSNAIDYENGIHYQSYLVEVDYKPYDLMATMRSTYNSIKYLQTIYPDSLIPFTVFDN
jgi:hypothetical protein